MTKRTAQQLTHKVYVECDKRGETRLIKHRRIVDTKVPLIDTRFDKGLANPFLGVGYEAADIKRELASALGIDVDGPSAIERIRNGEHLTQDEFKRQYLIDNLLSKYDGNPSYSEKPIEYSDHDSRAVRAMEKFMAAEERCRDINENGLRSDPVILARARRIIAEVLGPLDPLQIFEGARFTGGGSTSRKRATGSPWFKYHPSWQVDVTPAAYSLGVLAIESTPLWKELAETDASALLKIVPGNVVKFVYKNAQEYRVMCGEPDILQYWQQGTGYVIRNCLRGVGIDLDDDSFNQECARLGSIDNSICTADKSSASDLTARRVVVELFPLEWAEWLIKIASPLGKLPNGTWHRWEKISTMGNGYTFELESLIFYAVARATQEITGLRGPISVYGDDLIIPSAMFTRYREEIEGLGYIVNETKSHYQDYFFRESCGVHWFKGYNVKPFYIRKPVDTAPRVIWLLNRIRLWAYDEMLCICDPRVYDIWLNIYRMNRHWLRKVRGGHDPEQIEALCSPGKPKGLLKVVPYDIIPVGGIRGVLLHFNTCSRGDSRRIEIAQAYRYSPFKKVESKNEGLAFEAMSSDSSPVSHGIAISKPYLCLFLEQPEGIPINHNYYFPSEVEQPV